MLDWENAVQVKGKPAPYDKEIAVKVLTSVDERGMGQTFRDVVAYAAGIVADNHLGMAEDIALTSADRGDRSKRQAGAR